MLYFDDMNNKYGFSDGSAVPAEAWDSRKVYSRVLNVLLERFGSQVRVLPYDRGGMHNPCLWIRVNLETYNKVMTALQGEEPSGTECDAVEEVTADEEWYTAVAVADVMDLDACVEIKTSIRQDAMQAALQRATNGDLTELRLAAELDEDEDEDEDENA